MRVLSAAVVLGLSTPLVVLACGSDDGAKAADDNAAGEAGQGAGATAGKSNTGGSSSTAGKSAGGTAPGGGAAGDTGAGAADTGGAGGAGATDAGGAAGGDAGGAGGANNEPEPVCGDATVGGTLLCFNAPVPLTIVEGTPTDLAIGAWDDDAGLDVIVANSTGLSYFSGNATGTLTTDSYVGTAGIIVGAGQLDSNTNLDVLVSVAQSSSSTLLFGDGTGVAAKTEAPSFSGEGELYNYFVADVLGSSASQDVLVTASGSISLALTTGTEGEGFQGSTATRYPNDAKDAVLAKLGSQQWVVYALGAGLKRLPVTYDAGNITFGTEEAVAAGTTPEQLDVGDFNGDGFDDVAATLTGSGDVNVLFGDGVGTGDFKVVTGTDKFLTLTIGTSAESKTQRDIKVGDFNGDGHADLAVSVSGLDGVEIFSGDGAGGFAAPTFVSTGVGSGPTRLAKGDLNGDGVDDLAVVGGVSQKVIILLSDP